MRQLFGQLSFIASPSWSSSKSDKDIHVVEGSRSPLTQTYDKDINVVEGSRSPLTQTHDKDINMVGGSRSPLTQTYECFMQTEENQCDQGNR